MMEQVTSKEVIGQAIGRIASGVFIITAKQQSGQKVGMMASWVAQAGFEPPSITVAVHPDREVYKVIEESGQFTVNVLSNENMNLMKAFSRYAPEQFEGIDYADIPSGVVLKEAVAVIHCNVKGKLEGADHQIILGEVFDGDMLNADFAPMVHLRKSGFNY